MNRAEKYYEKWIKDIAKRTTKLGIKRHIINHARDLNNKNDNNPLRWAASMYNLLKTYEKIHRIELTPEIMLNRLLNKYNKNPYYYTPPPGKKIPRGIKVRKVKERTKN